MKYNKKEYSDYLNSKKWKDFRKRILKLNYGKKHKDKNHCEICEWDFADFELEIHHKTYKNLFNESVHDVQVLCKSCHEKADAIRDNAFIKIRPINKRTGARYVDIF